MFKSVAIKPDKKSVNAKEIYMKITILSVFLLLVFNCFAQNSDSEQPQTIISALLGVSCGALYLSGKIDDDAEEDDSDDFDFHDGYPDASDSGIGFNVMAGLVYQLNDYLGIAGYVQYGSVTLDFKEYEANGSGPGIGTTLILSKNK